jgi:hypothetical protein
MVGQQRQDEAAAAPIITDNQNGRGFPTLTDYEWFGDEIHRIHPASAERMFGVTVVTQLERPVAICSSSMGAIHVAGRHLTAGAAARQSVGRARGRGICGRIVPS